MASKGQIVFPTDFSDTSVAALPWATKMSQQLGTELHCVTVVEPPVVYTAMEVPLDMPTVEDVATHAAGQLEQFVREHLGSARTPVQKILIGRPVDEITRYADEIGAVMIVMATHGHSGLKHLLIGSTTEGVVRHANCPVLTIRSGSDA